MNKAIVIAGIFAAAVAGGAYAIATSEVDRSFDNTITGQLVNVTGNPIKDRAIVLTEEGAPPITAFGLNSKATAVIPDVNGDFAFNNLKPGCYNVRTAIEVTEGVALGYSDPKTVCIEGRKEILKPLLGPVTVDMGPIQ